MKISFLLNKLRFLTIFLFCIGYTQPCESTIRPLKISIIKDPSTLDPRQGGEIVGSLLHFILYDGLTRLQPDGSITLNLAKNVSISENQKKYTFELRAAQWSNGSKITAKDFEYSWKKILTPNFPAPNAPLLYPIKNAKAAKNGKLPLDAVGIIATSDTTLVVELERPTPYFLKLLTFCTFFPINHIIDQKNPHWMNTANDNFISSGAFKLVKWRQGNEILLIKNPLYWDANQINLDAIHIITISDQNTALQLYEKGDLDLIGFGYSPIPTESIPQLKNSLISYPVPATTIICFNISTFPFNNKNIRKAFAYSINRQEIVNNITQLEETIATNIIPPGLSEEEPMSYFKDRNTDLALYHFQLGLKELEIKKEQFPKITYTYSSAAAVPHKIAQSLQQIWESLFHIQISLKKKEPPIFTNLLTNKSYEIAQTFYFAQYNDPTSILDRFTNSQNPKNFSGWENEQYTHLVSLAAIETDTKVRNALFQSAERVLLEEMPIAPIYHWKTSFMMKPYLEHPPIAKHGIFEMIKVRFKN
jgi:oligopeptide transport system substrate-binding protein